MRTISSIVWLIVFVLLLGFALKNPQAATVRYYLGFEWIAPTYLIVLLALLLGAIVGILACVALIIKQKQAIKKLSATTLANNSD